MYETYFVESHACRVLNKLPGQYFNKSLAELTKVLFLSILNLVASLLTQPCCLF